MAKITNPFAGNPFNPFPNGSPLAQTARDFGPRINVISVEEQTRAAAIPAEIAAGQQAVNFKPVPTPAPFTPETDVAVPPPSKAGP